MPNKFRMKFGDLRGRAVELLLGFCAAVSVLTTIGIVLVLTTEAAHFVRDIGVAPLIFDTQWTPLYRDQHFGIWPLVSGTFLATAIAMLIAGPLGLLAAIYLTEFAGDGARRVLKPALELLAGVPTVVFGFLALVVVTPWLQTFVPGLEAFNALSAGMAMGLMITPTVATLCDDALAAVPETYREAALALGSERSTAVWKVLVPSARSGIIAAMMLGVSRALGETMIVVIAAGQQPNLTLDARQPVETMTAFIVAISMGDTPAGSIEFQTIFVVGFLLFCMTFVINALSVRIQRSAS